MAPHRRGRPVTAPPLQLPVGLRALADPGKYQCTICPGQQPSALSRALRHADSQQHRDQASCHRPFDVRTQVAGKAHNPAPVENTDLFRSAKTDAASVIADSCANFPNPVSLFTKPYTGQSSLPYDFDIPSTYQFDEYPFDDSLLREGRREMAADLSRLAPRTNDFAPFPDKATFVLALISNNPRRPFSRRQIKAIILSWKLLGVPNVPTYDQYKASLNRVRSTTGSRTVQVTGLAGTKLHIIPIADGLMSDFANPVLRPKLQLYARRVEAISSYQDSDHAMAHPTTTAPMIELGPGRHAYVQEVVELREGYSYITAWYEGEGGRLCAEGIRADRRGQRFCVSTEAVRHVDVRDIVRTAPELLQATCISELLKDGKIIVNESPLRRAAAGKMTYRIPLYVFLDDLSGASSKRWNKHLACYVQSAAMPANCLNSDSTIRLFAVLERASVQEISQALVEQIKSLHDDGVVCWDVSRQESVLVYGHVAAIVSDNPMAAELASNIGMKGNFFCRCCKVGGTAAYRESAIGLAAAVKPGESRNTPQLRQTLEEQIEKAGKGLVGTWSAQATSTGRIKEEDADEDEVLEKVDEIRREIVQEGKHLNPLFQLYELQAFDVTKDTPCEILHTVLLGTVKYLIRATVPRLTVQQKADLERWLGAANMVGIGDGESFRGNYAMRHAQSLVGKDFKRLAQIMPWALQQISAPRELVETWRLQGQLAAALHVPVLGRSSLAQWTAHLRSLMRAFFVSYARIVPTALPRKPKLHLLTHAIDDLLRFGPLPTVSAERFESYNAVVRQASVFSNRKQPSRDIARRLADEEMMRGFICGQVYTDPTDGRLHTSGPGLRNLFSTKDALRDEMLRLYGLEALLPKIMTRNANDTFKKATARRPAAVQLTSGDWARRNSYVMVRSEAADAPADGRSGAHLAKVVDVEVDQSSRDKDAHRLTVILLRWSTAQQHWALDADTVQNTQTIPSRNALAVVNTNHDCKGQGCRVSQDNIRHRGDLEVRVVNECAFRSAVLTAGLVGLRHDVLDDMQMGARLFSATGGKD
ncbi:hypothetical protein V8E36_004006 [Tilletia maclaganii]